MLFSGRPPGGLALVLLATLAVVSCAPANERPMHGALPGSDTAPTPLGVPPTLTASEALRFRALPTPSPGVAAVGPSPVASPSVVAAPPIVRTIAPSANGHVAAGPPVALSAVLVGRGADLATASLTVNGADAGAQIDRRSPREWSIHTSQSLAAGSHTAKVQVRDASGAAGGFTWQFVVGDATPTP